MTELSFPDMTNSSLEIYMNKCKENKAAATKWLHAMQTVTYYLSLSSRQENTFLLHS